MFLNTCSSATIHTLFRSHRFESASFDSNEEEIMCAQSFVFCLLSSFSFISFSISIWTRDDTCEKNCNFSSPFPLPLFTAPRRPFLDHSFSAVVSALLYILFYLFSLRRSAARGGRNLCVAHRPKRETRARERERGGEEKNKQNENETNNLFSSTLEWFSINCARTIIIVEINQRIVYLLFIFRNHFFLRSSFSFSHFVAYYVCIFICGVFSLHSNKYLPEWVPLSLALRSKALARAALNIFYCILFNVRVSRAAWPLSARPGRFHLYICTIVLSTYCIRKSRTKKNCNPIDYFCIRRIYYYLYVYL